MSFYPEKDAKRKAGTPLSLTKKSQWLLLGVAVFIRFLFSGVSIQEPLSDSLYALSQNIVTLQASHFPVNQLPGYPIFLAKLSFALSFLGRIPQAELLESLAIFYQTELCILITFLVAGISLKLFQHQSLALWTGLLTACLPDLLYAEHSVSPWVFSAVLILGGFYSLLSWQVSQKNKDFWLSTLFWVAASWFSYAALAGVIVLFTYLFRKIETEKSLPFLIILVISCVLIACFYGIWGWPGFGAVNISILTEMGPRMIAIFASGTPWDPEGILWSPLLILGLLGGLWTFLQGRQTFSLCNTFLLFGGCCLAFMLYSGFQSQDRIFLEPLLSIFGAYASWELMKTYGSLQDASTEDIESEGGQVLLP